MNVCRRLLVCVIAIRNRFRASASDVSLLWQRYDPYRLTNGARAATIASSSATCCAVCGMTGGGGGGSTRSSLVTLYEMEVEVGRLTTKVSTV